MYSRSTVMVVSALVAFIAVSMPFVQGQSPAPGSSPDPFNPGYPLGPKGPLPAELQADIDDRSRKCRRDRNNFCKTWVCQQNVNRLARMWTAFGGADSVKTTCDDQQNVPNFNLNQLCTIDGKTVNIGAYALQLTCTPEGRQQTADWVFQQTGVVVPQGSRPPAMFAPPSVVARGITSGAINDAVYKESEFIFAQDPNICGGLTLADAVCSQKIRDIVLAPGYVTQVPGNTIPSCVDRLTAEYLANKAYVTEIWARKAAELVCSGQKNTVTLGDPHMRGFSGDSFDFNGHDGGVYALFSEANHQVNSLFRTFEHIASDASNTSTWMQAVGFRYRGDVTIEFHIEIENMSSLAKVQGPDGLWRVEPPTSQYMRLVVNGNDWSEKIRTDTEELIAISEEDDIKVFLPTATKEDEPNDGAVVVITTSVMEVTIMVETEGVVHCDAQMKLINSPVGIPAGILGETILWTVPGAVKELSGEDSNYEVSTLLSSDCTSCDFNGAEPAPAAWVQTV